ncbi:hypothetical protein SDC9_124037 [bioreactor metagenome]|uniref:Uncharacterized protein n=1 Tax=bioreactor metagenome TaxID=1076179 RepID=A0A645CJF8_9ZZZZ
MDADNIVASLCGHRARVHGHRRREHAPKLMIRMVAANLAAPRRGKQRGAVVCSKRALKRIRQRGIFHLLRFKSVSVEVF